MGWLKLWVVEIWFCKSFSVPYSSKQRWHILCTFGKLGTLALITVFVLICKEFMSCNKLSVFKTLGEFMVGCLISWIVKRWICKSIKRWLNFRRYFHFGPILRKMCEITILDEYLFQDLKFKISEGSDQNWSFSDSALLAVPVLKVLKYFRNCSLQYTLIPWSLKKCDTPYTTYFEDFFSTFQIPYQKIGDKIFVQIQEQFLLHILKIAQSFSYVTLIGHFQLTVPREPCMTKI